MAIYIVLGQFTDQGVRNIKDTTKRAQVFREMARRGGVTVKDIYWTLGEYDFVVLAEGPDDETATALMLSVAALGNIKTQTMRAFTPAEMTQIIAKLM
jgi:uncharacterized protein with GYD domain